MDIHKLLPILIFTSLGQLVVSQVDWNVTFDTAYSMALARELSPKPVLHDQQTGSEAANDGHLHNATSSLEGTHFCEPINNDLKLSYYENQILKVESWYGHEMGRIKSVIERIEAEYESVCHPAHKCECPLTGSLAFLAFINPCWCKIGTVGAGSSLGSFGILSGSSSLTSPSGSGPLSGPPVVKAYSAIDHVPPGTTLVVALGGYNPKLGPLANGEFVEQIRDRSGQVVLKPATIKWQFLSRMHEKRQNFVSATIEGRIYAIGGCRNPYTHGSKSHEKCFNYTKQIERFDYKADRWTVTHELNEPEASAVYHTGPNMYIFGKGWLERVSPYEFGFLWHRVNPMIYPRNESAVVAHLYSFYVTGGRKEGVIYSTVERYDSKKNKWDTISPMEDKRAGHAGAELDGIIYVSGGYSIPNLSIPNDPSTDADESVDEVCLSSVERYDPLSDEWETIASLATPRRYHAMAAIGGLLYVAGGEDCNGRVLKSVEVYRPDPIVTQPLSTVQTDPSPALTDSQNGTDSEERDLAPPPTPSPTLSPKRNDGWKSAGQLNVARSHLSLTHLIT